MALTPWEPEDTAASLIQTVSANSLQGEVAPLFLHYGWVFLSLSVLGLVTMVRHRAVIWRRAPGLLAFVGLPGFDEFVLGYRDRSLVLAPEHANKIVPGGNGVFRKTIVAGGEVIGTWAGPGKGRSAAVVPGLFSEARPLGPAAAAPFNKAAAR